MDESMPAPATLSEQLQLLGDSLVTPLQELHRSIAELGARLPTDSLMPNGMSVGAEGVTSQTRGLVPGLNPQFFEEGAAETIVNENTEGKLLRILSFNWDLKTSAEAGERFVGYEIQDPKGHTQVEVLTPALSKTSELYGICGFLGATGPVSPATSRTINLALPQLLLPKGWKWEAIAPFKKPGDSFPIFRLAVEFV